MGGGGTWGKKVTLLFAIWSMWYWLIGFLLAFRSIWSYDMIFFLSFTPLQISRSSNNKHKSYCIA
jgi:hypothetical protein